DKSNAVAVKFLEHHAENNRSPADEDGRRIKVRHRGPAFQHHAKDESRRVNDEANPQQAFGGHTPDFGLVRPVKHDEEKSRDVNVHGPFESQHPVKELFAGTFLQWLCESELLKRVAIL